MDDADRLNEVLRRDHPAIVRSLSPLGLRAAFPRGIPFQADEAKNSRIDATIGQLTDGEGRPLPLPALSSAVDGLDPAATFLYAPVDGPKALRAAWGARERRLGQARVGSSTPVVTHGLTHGLALVSDLFADPDTDVLVPSPAWENYELVFQLHAGARIVPYAVTSPTDPDRLDLEGLARTLAGVRSKAILVLNLPSNPLGWTPRPDDVAGLVEVIAAHPGPLVVVTDDAYQGWVYTAGRQVRSVFWDLAERADPERHVILKADAATKELMFFSSRVGFLTHTTTTAPAEVAMLSKLKYVIRGTVGSASGPALAMVARALGDPTLEDAVADRRSLLSDRYRTLEAALASLDPERMRVRPFNAAFFVFVELGGGLDADAVRRALLAEASVGTIAFRAENALRLAYCSIAEARLPELVDALARAAG
ncbi:MAG: aminotransferase class I/II-fold pyridoxal phosphate-dependent enzyme [Myxococcota bacterium]